MKLLIIIVLIIKSSATPTVGVNRDRCLMGVMTDVQSWVTDDGSLASDVGNMEAIDLSSVTDPVVMLQQAMGSFKANRVIRYLSLAKCKLTFVPSVFELKDGQERSLSTTVVYLSLYGNNFRDSTQETPLDITMNATSAVEIRKLPENTTYGESQWSIGLRNVNFTSLKELDLRASNIRSLSDYVFSGMPNLEALYLSENKITYISGNAFSGLHNIIHIDLSRNNLPLRANSDIYMEFENTYVFKDLRRLNSLDFSFTKLSPACNKLFRNMNSALEILSLCHSGLTKMPNYSFNGTSLRHLDVSENPDILYNADVLGGTERTLTVVYAQGVALNGARVFQNFYNLEILRLANNELTYISTKEARSWKNLQVLILDSNRMSPWFQETFSLIPNLKLLALRENNINIISSIMMNDIQYVDYLALSGNFFVCNCYLRELYEIAYENEVNLSLTNETVFVTPVNDASHVSSYQFHTGYLDVNGEIASRMRINCTREVNSTECSFNSVEVQHSGEYLLLDYSEEDYSCLLAQLSEFETFAETDTCPIVPRDTAYSEVIVASQNRIYLAILIPVLLVPALVVAYCHKRIRYFCITIKNSATLSLIDDAHREEDGEIYNYDVFVSYCNEDRWWVLDNLLAHVERDCNVSMCLHERDFQVGLSILENIVSCMDRSKSIMLIISQKFLKSQWCQFEMHLAQHRLLETRREDLILILLEDIPRKMRPNTLHYLMLTKTYIVWPKEANEQKMFWKRIRKCLVTQTMKQVDNVSLA